ncbi:Phospholipid phosphatase 1, partial [Armadillidium nasatum]
VVVVLLLSFTGVIFPHNTYIQCNDPSISHDYYKDTISVAALISISIIVPFLVMVIVEWINFLHRPIPSPFKRSFKRSYSLFSWYFIGNLFSLCIVEILKSTVSEPRPNFMSTCSPNLTEEVCKHQYVVRWIHITYENCTNPMKLSHVRLLDTMKSFPSGHASISVFTALFMTIYTHERVKTAWSELLPMWLNLIWWIWASVCSASRVWDKKHHWWDVIVGGIIGVVISYATVKCICKNFIEREKCSTSEDKFSTGKISTSPDGRGTINIASFPHSEVKETSIPQAIVPNS